jgi:hypothetical protein
MARIQYQGAAKAGGYRPQQVDERNIARIREESQRQIEGMRAVADAEIKSRREVAQAMKENAAYTANAEERNFQIQSQNTQRELTGLQTQAQRDLQQFNQDQKATEQIFESISTLSSSASKLVNKIQEAKKEEAFKQEFYDQDPNANAITQAIRSEQIAQARIAEQAKLAGIQEAEANGADKVAAAKLKAQNPVAQYDFTEGTVAKFFRYQYVDERNARLKELERQKGAPLTSEEKRLGIAKFRDQIYSIVGAERISADLVKPYVEEADNYDRAFYSTEREKQKKELDDQRGEFHTTVIAQAPPDKLQQVFNSSFPHLVDIYGYKGALDKLEDIFSQQDPKTGSFYFNEANIRNLKFYTPENPQGITFADKFGKTRLAEILNKRVKLDMQFRKQQLDVDDLSNSELEDTLFRGLGQNPTEQKVKDAQKLYASVSGRESTKLNTIAKSLTIEAQSRERTITSITNLRDFELTPEIVAAAQAADPTKGNVIAQRYAAYNAKWSNDAYKKANKSLETLVAGTTSFGTTKAATAGSLPIISYLQSELRRRTGLYESTLGFTAASQKAAQELTNEYTQGYKDKNSPFYRKVSRTGTVSYPRLEPVAAPAAERQRRVIEEMKKTVKKVGIEDTVKTSIPPERLEYIKANFTKPTFKPTPQEVALVGMSNGMPLHELYNLAFKTQGQNFRLGSPLKMGDQELKFDEQDLKILTDPTKGRNAKMAVVQRILNPNAFRDGTTMRPGSPLQRTLVTQARDDSARSLGSDFVIEGGKRGAEYLFPADATVLKVVTGRNEEYRRETGDQRRGYGNNVEVRMQTPYGPADFLFAHFDKIGNLKPGQTVKAGTFMGTQGRTGSTTGAHVSVDAFYPDSFNPNRQAREWFLKTFLQQ